MSTRLFHHKWLRLRSVAFVYPSLSHQTIEFPDDELVEPLEGLDIAEDGIALPPPPAPEPEPEVAPAKPNLLVSKERCTRWKSLAWRNPMMENDRD